MSKVAPDRIISKSNNKLIDMGYETIEKMNRFLNKIYKIPPDVKDVFEEFEGKHFIECSKKHHYFVCDLLSYEVRKGNFPVNQLEKRS